MRHGAQSPLPPLRDAHARGGQRGNHGLRHIPLTEQIEHDDVRLRRGRSDGLTVRQYLGKFPGVCVVFADPFEIGIQRVQSGSGQDSGLPHAAPQALANFPRAGPPGFPESQA